MGKFKGSFGSRIKFVKKRRVSRTKPIQRKVLEWVKKMAIQIANQLIKKTLFIEYQNYSKINPCQQFKVIKFSVKISNKL